MKNILISLVFYLMSFSAIAVEESWEEINAWIGSGFSQVRVVYPDKSYKSFQAVITDDPDGKQVVEFHFRDSKRNKCSSPDNGRLSNMVMKINGKRVKMKAGCKYGWMEYVLRYFATTMEGRLHIVESFKTGLPVPVRMQGYDVKFPAKGFAKAWDNYGGDAI